ncbi:MAG: hypothetical protein WA736_04180, partial [Candidatus Acidiferrum sp.]
MSSSVQTFFTFFLALAGSLSDGSSFAPAVFPAGGVVGAEADAGGWDWEGWLEPDDDCAAHTKATEANKKVADKR